MIINNIFRFRPFQAFTAAMRAGTPSTSVSAMQPPVFPQLNFLVPVAPSAVPPSVPATTTQILGAAMASMHLDQAEALVLPEGQDHIAQLVINQKLMFINQRELLHKSQLEAAKIKVSLSFQSLSSLIQSFVSLVQPMLMFVLIYMLMFRSKVIEPVLC